MQVGESPALMTVTLGSDPTGVRLRDPLLPGGAAGAARGSNDTVDPPGPTGSNQARRAGGARANRQCLPARRQAPAAPNPGAVERSPDGRPRGPTELDPREDAGSLRRPGGPPHGRRRRRPGSDRSDGKRYSTAADRRPGNTDIDRSRCTGGRGSQWSCARSTPRGHGAAHCGSDRSRVECSSRSVAGGACQPP